MCEDKANVRVWTATSIHRPENMVKFIPPEPPTRWDCFKWWFEDRVLPWLLLATAWLNIYVGLMVMYGK